MRTVDLTGVRAFLCDADGNLFPSEEPAFVASADVTNRRMAELGIDRRFAPEQLRLTTTGKNFRTTAVDLALAAGVSSEDANAGLEWWVEEEKRAVSAHLESVLRPDPDVVEPLAELERVARVAAVSSSALSRLQACFRATGLDRFFDPGNTFSAEDSLPAPTSKPDPAVYLHALERLGVAGDEALAIEDSVPGVQSAVAAGVPTVGNVVFVPKPERDARRGELLDAGAVVVVSSWREIAAAVPVAR